MMDSSCNIAEETTAKEFEERAISRLSQTGLRVTRPRKLVVRILAETRKPLGAYQIRERVLESGGKIDVVSVYRFLAWLVEAGLAHHIGVVDGYIKCTSHLVGTHQTEHLVCQLCGCVEEVAVPQPAQGEISASASRMGFLPKSMRVEVLGTCSHCR